MPYLLCVRQPAHFVHHIMRGPALRFVDNNDSVHWVFSAVQMYPRVKFLSPSRESRNGSIRAGGACSRAGGRTPIQPPPPARNFSPLRTLRASSRKHPPSPPISLSSKPPPSKTS